MRPASCAIQGRALRHILRGGLRLKGCARTSLGTAPCQITQNTSRGLNRCQRLRVGAQAAVNPLGHKKQGIIVQSLPSALTDSRHKCALQSGAVFKRTAVAGAQAVYPQLCRRNLRI